MQQHRFQETACKRTSIERVPAHWLSTQLRMVLACILHLDMGKLNVASKFPWLSNHFKHKPTTEPLKRSSLLNVKQDKKKIIPNQDLSGKTLTTFIVFIFLKFYLYRKSSCKRDTCQKRICQHRNRQSSSFFNYIMMDS